jgi:Skp family chaperone for outer membrane proteins
MILSSLIGASVALSTVGAAVGAAAAATPPVLPPNAAGATSIQPITGGPVIPGVCLVSPEAILANSKVGQAMNLQLQHLAADADQQMKPERASLEADAQALQAQKTLPAAQVDQKRQALAERVRAFQVKVDTLNRRLEYTHDQVITRISQQAQPVIAAVYTTHSCGLLFRRSDVVAGNMANDLTAEVVRNLDAKITSLPFELETPPTPATDARPAA